LKDFDVILNLLKYLPMIYIFKEIKKILLSFYPYNYKTSKLRIKYFSYVIIIPVN